MMPAFQSTPTTVQYLLIFLRNLSLPGLTPQQINYGLSDNTAPAPNPYVVVSDYSHTMIYNVAGATQRDSKWKIHVYGQTVDIGEDTAALIDSYVNLSKTITPYTMGTFQESWQIVQEPLYVAHTVIEYSMQESLQ